MTDKEFWVEMRRAAIIIIRAVEKRFGLPSL